MNYFYANAANEPVGPLPEEQIHELYRNRTISLDTFIVAEGSSEWQSYRTITKTPIPPPAQVAPQIQKSQAQDVTNSTKQETQKCPFCAEYVSFEAKKCKHCGETIDVALRAAEEAKRNNTMQPMVFMNAGGGAAVAGNNTGQIIGIKSRITAALLAIFLGGLGIHKFYLGQPVWGFIYILFCWTGIPSLIGLLEGITYLLSSDRSFALRYG